MVKYFRKFDARAKNCHKKFLTAVQSTELDTSKSQLNKITNNESQKLGKITKFKF